MKRDVGEMEFDEMASAKWVSVKRMSAKWVDITATNIYVKIKNIQINNVATKIIKSPDIGPITNNPNAIYKSRPLSAMIKSAILSTIRLKSSPSELGK